MDGTIENDRFLPVCHPHHLVYAYRVLAVSGNKDFLFFRVEQAGLHETSIVGPHKREEPLGSAPDGSQKCGVMWTDLLVDAIIVRCALHILRKLTSKVGDQ